MEQGVEVSEPKPFDLEKAKAGGAIMYQGKPVKFGAYLPDAYEACRVVVITSEGYLLHANEEGYVTGFNYLTMAPKKRKVVVRLYREYGIGGEIATVNAPLSKPWTLIKEETWEVPE